MRPQTGIVKLNKLNFSIDGTFGNTELQGSSCYGKRHYKKTNLQANLKTQCRFYFSGSEMLRTDSKSCYIGQSKLQSEFDVISKNEMTYINIDLGKANFSGEISISHQNSKANDLILGKVDIQVTSNSHPEDIEKKIIDFYTFLKVYSQRLLK